LNADKIGVHVACACHGLDESGLLSLIIINDFAARDKLDFAGV
jgi:hypothetical protein